MKQKPYFRTRHLIKDSDRLIMLKCMQNLLEAIQLFGGRMQLEVIKKKTHLRATQKE